VLRILPTVRLVTGDQVQARIAAFLEADGEDQGAPDPEADQDVETASDQDEPVAGT
jgi:hypothetical protein